MGGQPDGLKDDWDERAGRRMALRTLTPGSEPVSPSGKGFGTCQRCSVDFPPCHPAAPAYRHRSGRPADGEVTLAMPFGSAHIGSTVSIMILPQVHLRKPCYDFYFL